MIYPMIPFPVTLSDPLPRLQGHGVTFRHIDAINVLCAQLTHELLAISKFLYFLNSLSHPHFHTFGLCMSSAVRHHVSDAYVKIRVMCGA